MGHDSWQYRIYARVVRLFFDILHGIKRMDVPLIMVLELLIFLGFDGKLEANSEMEKDLFLSAIDQLKERFIHFPYNINIYFNIYCKHYTVFIFGIFEGNKNDKARKCTYMAISEDMGKIWRSCY